MTTGRDRLRRAYSAHVLREALQEIEATALVTNEHVEEMADQIAEVLTERGLTIVKVQDNLIRVAQRTAWNNCVQEAYDCGWLHGPAADDMQGRNPYPVTESPEGSDE